MMEVYILTTLQLDAIGRVCDCATENESEYIRFVESEIKGEHNWDRDLAMLGVRQQPSLRYSFFTLRHTRTSHIACPFFLRHTNIVHWTQIFQRMSNPRKYYEFLHM